MLCCPAAARQSFKEQEALVYQQLAQLIRDAVWLKSYIAAVMRLEQEAFQSAYASLGPSKATLPLQPDMSMPAEQVMMATSGSAATRPMTVETPPQVNHVSKTLLLLHLMRCSQEFGFFSIMQLPKHQLLNSCCDLTCCVMHALAYAHSVLTST